MTAASDSISVPTTWRARLRRRAAGYLLNPLLVRDLRSFLRGRRPMFLQMGYLAITAAAMAIAALICRSERAQMMQYHYAALPSYGQFMFIAMFETQVVLLFLVVVGYSAGAITLEHEKRTYEMLAVTSLTTLELIIGKIAAITLLCAMLLCTSLPVAALCFIMGGISPEQVLVSYALLLFSIPLWSSLCLLVSSVLPRTIAAYVVSLVCLGLVLLGLSYLSVHASDMIFLGALSPFLAPFLYEGTEFEFRLFTHVLPGWLPALMVYPPLCLLAIVAAAEALPLHRPRRSLTLRLLVLLNIFGLVGLAFSAFVQLLLQPMYGARLAGGMPTPSSTPGGAPLLSALPDALAYAWVFACLVVPLVSCYVPAPREGEDALGWLVGRLPFRQWFQREANAGWRFVLLCFGAFVAAILLPLILTRVLKVVSPPLFTSTGVAMLLFALMLYALSLTAYACWGAALTRAYRDRRIAAAVIFLLVLALNLLGVYSVSNPYSFQKVQFLIHPVLALTSPIPAAAAALGNLSAPYWPKQWASPWYVIGLSTLYQVALLVGGWVDVRRAGRK
jgi:ABC-type transport system involved in multi-copper enzyme maturation permease subunit